jgi:hypothetical protein
MTQQLPEFIPGLELNRAFFSEVVEPLMTEHFPGLKYSAGLIGIGSDVLGFDSPKSMDHNWGPRLVMFLTMRDYSEKRDEVDKMLRENLPLTFKGFPTNYTQEDPNAYLKQQMEFKESEEVNHYIQIFTIKDFLKHYLGFDRDKEITIKDWLTFPQQSLIEITGGEIYYDGLGELNELRDKLSYFPRDVWLYSIRVGWGRVHTQVQFGARTGEEGDEAGSRIMAARHIEEIMKMVFILERQYFPYIKWFGTAFKRNLKSAEFFLPLFDRIFNSSDWKERQDLLTECWQKLGKMHNELGITKECNIELTDFHGRGYNIMDMLPFIHATEEAIQDPEIKGLHYTLGQIDQFINHARINHEDFVYRAMKDFIR